LTDISNRVQLEDTLERALMAQVRSAERARRQEEELRLILDSTTEGIWRFDTRFRTTFVNQRMADLLGVEADDLIGRDIFDFVGPNDRDRLREAVQENERSLAEATLVRAGGTAFPVLVSTGAVAAGAGTQASWLAVVSDLTSLRDTEEALHTMREEFQTIFERSPLGISIVGLDGTFQRVNQALCDMSGFTAEQLIGWSADLLVAEEDRDRINQSVLKGLYLDRAEHVTQEIRLERSDGKERWMLVDSTLVCDSAGEPMFFVTISSDITDRKMLEERLVHQASHDHLTGLPNRAMLRELIAQGVARTSRRNSPMAVMFVDLDFFKDVNDNLGHAAGDDLLEQVGARLLSSVRLGDVVGRWGGDEFVVLCEDIGGSASAQSVAQRVCDALSSPFVVEDTPVSISASVGVALSYGDECVDGLLARADVVLYQAKRQGRARAVLAPLEAAPLVGSGRGVSS
jgi:diguanylate cyclase (GGDEF)-like protein/PAS domain S-box-containing protein